MERSKSRFIEKLIPLSIFLFAFGLRLIYLIQQSRYNPVFSSPIMDPLVHDTWARRIAAGDFLGSEVFFRAPLYYYFLGLIYFVFGPDYFLARLIQSLIGSASVVLVFFLTRRIFNAAVALLAALLASSYWIFIYFDNELLIVPLSVFLNLALILALLKSGESGAARPWFFSGLLLGFSAIARPNILIFIPFVPIWLWLGRRKEWRLGRVARATILFFLGASVIITPVTLRNYFVGKDFVLISSQAGVNFYIGNNPASDGITAIVPGTRGDWWGGYRDTIRIAEEARGKRLKPSEVSDYWFQQAFHYISTRPGHYLKLLARKFYLFWQARELVNNQSVYFFRSYSGLMKLPLPAFGVIAPLGLAGMVLARRYWRKTLLLYFFVFAYMISVILFFINARYRVPIVPFLIIFAAYAVYWFHLTLRKKDYRPLIKFLALFFVLFIFVYSSSFTFFRGFVFPEYAQAHHILANAYLREGRTEMAEAECQKALRLGPELPEVRASLGDVYRLRGDTEAAIGQYRRALALNPLLLGARINLGALYNAQGKTGEAVVQLQQALMIDPACAPAYNNLGTVYFKSGRLEEAEKNFRLAVKFDPELIAAWKNLGEIYSRQGRDEEALLVYQEILSRKPDDMNVRFQQGSLYYRSGRFDEAIAAYEQLLALQPGHAAALNNLGYIYLEEKNNPQKGMELIKKAFALKPENPDVLDSLGRAYYRLGNYSEALRHLQKAADLVPDNPRVRQHLREVNDALQTP